MQGVRSEVATDQSVIEMRCLIETVSAASRPSYAAISVGSFTQEIHDEDTEDRDGDDDDYVIEDMLVEVQSEFEAGTRGVWDPAY